MDLSGICLARKPRPKKFKGRPVSHKRLAKVLHKFSEDNVFTLVHNAVVFSRQDPKEWLIDKLLEFDIEIVNEVLYQFGTAYTIDNSQTQLDKESKEDKEREEAEVLLAQWQEFTDVDKWLVDQKGKTAG